MVNLMLGIQINECVDNNGFTAETSYTYNPILFDSEVGSIASNALSMQRDKMVCKVKALVNLTVIAPDSGVAGSPSSERIKQIVFSTAFLVAGVVLCALGIIFSGGIMIGAVVALSLGILLYDQYKIAQIKQALNKLAQENPEDAKILHEQVSAHITTLSNVEGYSHDKFKHRFFVFDAHEYVNGYEENKYRYGLIETLKEVLTLLKE